MLKNCPGNNGSTGIKTKKSTGIDDGHGKKILNYRRINGSVGNKKLNSTGITDTLGSKAFKHIMFVILTLCSVAAHYW